MIKTKKLFLNSLFIYFISLLTSGLISFVTIPLIVKNYGIVAYGSFSIIQNIILLFISFGCGWLNQSILRFNNYSLSFKVSISHLFFFVLVPLSIACFIVLFFMNVGFLLTLAVTITMFLGSISSLLITFYQSRFNAKKSFYFDFVRIITFFLMVLLLSLSFFKNDSLTNLILAFLISYVVSFVFLLFVDYKFLLTSIRLFIAKINKKYFCLHIENNKHLLQYGWPLALWFTISMLLNVSDRYIIGYYLTGIDLGIYSAIYDLLYKGITLIYAPILVAGYPIMAKKYNAGQESEAYQFLRHLILLEVVIFVGIIIVAYFFKSFFIEIIVGIPITLKSLELVIPIICGAFVWQLAMLVHKPLELKLKTKTMMYFILSAFIINIVLNFIYIPIYGILFAAYSTFFAALVYLLLIFFHHKL